MPLNFLWNVFLWSSLNLRELNILVESFVWQLHVASSHEGESEAKPADRWALVSHMLVSVGYREIYCVISVLEYVCENRTASCFCSLQKQYFQIRCCLINDLSHDIIGLRIFLFKPYLYSYSNLC